MLHCSKGFAHMVARWDAILVVAALAGGWMLIENSHRLDIGAPDVEVVATSACDTAVSFRILWKAGTENAENEDPPEAMHALPGCPSD